jgi:hypothetical protein
LSSIIKLPNIDLITSLIKTQNIWSPLHIELRQHAQRPNHSPSLPPIVHLLPLPLALPLPLPLALPLPLPLAVGCLPPPIELAVSFSAPLAFALGKNNANRLGRIKFQQGKIISKLEFN